VKSNHYYSTDTSFVNRVEHIVAGHRRGKGDTSVQVDEDQSTHDWAPKTKAIFFINRTPLGTDEVKATHPFE
jgi:hypothetical protein